MFNGWIETGGNLNLTSTSDLVIRTTEAQNQYLVFGNGSNQIGAVYVENNNVGIKRAPQSNYVLSIDGSARVSQDIHVYPNAYNTSNMTTRMEMTCSNVALYNNTSNVTYLYGNGVSRTRMLIADMFKTPSVESKIASAQILQIAASNVQDTNNQIRSGYYMKLDSIHSDKIPADGVLLIQKQVFQVWSKNIIGDDVQFTDRLLVYVEFSPLYEDQGAITFQDFDIIDIDILDDVSSGNASNIVTLYREATVVSYTLYDNFVYPQSELHVILRIQNPGGDFISIGSYYTFKSSKTQLAINQNPTYILVLTNTTDLTDSNSTSLDRLYSLTFYSANKRDNLTDIANTFLAELTAGSVRKTYIFPLDALIPPDKIDETNISVGYVTVDGENMQKHLYISNSRLLNNTSTYSVGGPCHGIDSITVDDETMPVREHYAVTTDNSVVVDVGDMTRNDFVIMRRNISYRYLGVPIIIRSASLVAGNTIQYTFELMFGELFDFIKLFKNKYAYIMDTYRDAVWVLGDVISTLAGTLTMTVKIIDPTLQALFPDITDIPFILQPRVVYIVPFKLIKLEILGSEDNLAYIPSSLGIGTTNVRERLTVNGTLSLKQQLTFYSDTSRKPYYVSYSSNALSLGTNATLDATTARFYTDMETTGNITANELFKTSDIRLKHNICETKPCTDLENLLKLNIKTYHMTNAKNKTLKGVIAQEILTIYPEAVFKEPGILHFAKDVKANLKYDTLHIDADCSQEAFKLLTPGVTLVIKHPIVGEAHFIVHAVYESKSLVKLYNKHASAQQFNDNSQVQLLYILDDVYKVNYEYLYASAINAIKTLHRDVQNLKSLLFQALHT